MTIARALRLAAIPVVLLLLWQFIPGTGLVSATKLPPLTTVLASAVDLAASGRMARDVVASLTRVLSGFGLTIVLGTVIGFLISRFWLLGRLFDPLLQALRLMPVVAAAPLFILWFGFGETSKVAIITAMGFFPMYLAALTAFRSVNPELREVARVLGFGFLQTLLRLEVPAALPRIISGARFALLLSWMSLAVAELIGSESGIGNLAMSSAAVNPANVFVAVILFAVLAKSTDGLFVLVTRPLISWESSLRISSPPLHPTQQTLRNNKEKARA